MMFVCIARDSGGIRSAGRSPSSRGYIVAEAESRAIDIISSPQPRIKKLPPRAVMQTTARFIGRGFWGWHSGAYSRRATPQKQRQSKILCRYRLQK